VIRRFTCRPHFARVRLGSPTARRERFRRRPFCWLGAGSHTSRARYGWRWTTGLLVITCGSLHFHLPGKEPGGVRARRGAAEPGCRGIHRGAPALAGVGGNFQKALAKRVDYRPSYVSKVERGNAGRPLIRRCRDPREALKELTSGRARHNEPADDPKSAPGPYVVVEHEHAEPTTRSPWHWRRPRCSAGAGAAENRAPSRSGRAAAKSRDDQGGRKSAAPVAAGRIPATELVRRAERHLRPDVGPRWRNPPTRPRSVAGH